MGGRVKLMTTKTLKNPLVEFFATSRLAHAYRGAARRNRHLAQWATIHELGHGGSLSEVIGHVHKVKIVVLSHADDDPLMLTGLEMEPVISGAFHMLFTEPATHPDQVAQWMRTTKIRSCDTLDQKCTAWGHRGKSTTHKRPSLGLHHRLPARQTP